MDNELGLPNFDVLFYLIIALVIFSIGLMIYGQYEESKFVYEMPNGVICEQKLMRGGGAFSVGSTFEFRQCEDGEKYINPEHFEEIRK